RDDAALAPHRAHGIGFLFAEQADAPHRRAGEVIVNDGLNAWAERPMQINDAATDQAAARDVNDNGFNIFPFLIVERVFFVCKDGHLSASGVFSTTMRDA